MSLRCISLPPITANYRFFALIASTVCSLFQSTISAVYTSFVRNTSDPMIIIGAAYHLGEEDICLEVFGSRSRQRYRHGNITRLYWYSLQKL